MTGKAGLKAGLIGVAIMLMHTGLSRLLPSYGSLVWVSAGVSLLVYAGIGVLAGLLLTPPRTPGKGAGAGAIASLMSGLVAGAVGTAIMVIQMASGEAISGLSPEQMQQIQQLTESGMDPATFALLAIPGLACVVAIGTGLSAASGAIVAAVKPD